MDVRSPFFSNLALILAGAMFLNPIVATAAQVTVDGNRTQVGAAGNGVPVVNIATPNGNGLSHNTFKDYNVGKQGLILNNSTNRTQETQLGGIIVGNSNLNGKAASMILNEVTGSNRSQLQGYTEVAGQAARVIVANPHGITCDGCGFINTPHATLTTGKPVLDNGRLSHFDVNGGDIAIEGAGINAGNMDQFDLITRSAKINAEIHANELNVITGRNQVDATTLKATAKADDGSDKPKLAIDSSALGGMYAGAIRLVGTESGVGVKLAGDLAASGGDIQIDANGQLTLAQTAAQKDINITARQVELTDKVYAQGQANVKASGTLSNRQSLAAAQQVTVQAGTLNNSGIIEAGVNANNTRNTQADLKVAAQTVNNTGALIANRNLQVNATTALNNQGTLSGKSAASIDATTLNNRGGQILANTQLDVKASTLNNSADGLINSAQTLKVQAGQINNQGGELSAKGGVTVTASTLDNQQGRVIAEKGLQVTTTGAVDNRGGTLAAKEALTLNSGSLNNSADGLVNAGTNLNVKTGALNNQGGELSAKGQVNVTATSLNNLQGKVIAEQGLAIGATQQINNQGGTIAALDSLTLTAASLDNSINGLVNSAKALTLSVAQIGNHTGELSAKGQMVITGASLSNQQGKIVTEQGLSLSSQGINNQGGTIAAQSDLRLVTASLDNSLDGLINSARALTLEAEQISNRAGELSAKGAVAITAASLDSRQGAVISEQSLDLSISGQLNNSDDAVISAGQGLNVVAGSLDNHQGGTLVSRGDMSVQVQGALDNSAAGTLSSGGNLQVSSGSLNNAADGLLSSTGEMELTGGAVNNQSGLLVSKAGLQASVGNIDNRSGVISSEGGMNLRARVIDNRDLGLITSYDRLTLQATSLDSSNQGEVSASDDLLLIANQLTQQQGQLVGGGAVTLQLNNGLLDNQGGLISAQGPLTLQALRELDNRGGEVSSNQSFLVRADLIDNSNGGLIISAGQLQLDAQTLLNRNKGLISGWQGVAITGVDLDNRDLGTISSREGAIDVVLSGALDNRNEGALVSRGDQSIQAGSLNNGQGGILSTDGNLNLQLSDQLNNQSGLISAAGSLIAMASALNNNGGQLAAQQITINAQSLDNIGGQISAEGNMYLTLQGNLDNSGKGQIASGGDLELKGADLNNQGGTIVSQGQLKLAAQSLDNSNSGTLAAREAAKMAVVKMINNSKDGLIYSLKQSAEVAAGTLNNDAGVIQSQNGLALQIDNALSNRQGQILTEQGGLDIQATSLNNQSGILNAFAGWLSLQLAGAFDNSKGTAQGDTLSVTSGDLDNTGGHLSAVTGDANIEAGLFDNQRGGLYAKQSLKLVASSFANQGGQAAAQNIDFGLAGALNNSGLGIIESLGNLTLSAASINNQQGALRSLGTTGETRIVSSGLLDNRAGTIETANTHMKFQLGSLNNLGGTLLHVGTGDFSLAPALLAGAGGSLITNGRLEVNQTSWTNSTALQARNLVLNVQKLNQTETGQLLASQSLSGTGNNWVNQGLIASDGTIDLNLTGRYSGDGQLTSLDQMTLKAGSLELSEKARIISGGMANITTTGELLNRGVLTTVGDLTLRAGTLNNYGTLGSSERLTINAPTLYNENGLIFSGADMALYVGDLINKTADIYSLGGLVVARNDALGWSGSINNLSGSIESAGDMVLHAGSIDNESIGFEIGQSLVSGGVFIVCNDCQGDTYNVDYVVLENFKSIAEGDGLGIASISSGSNINIKGDGFFNYAGQVSASGNIDIEVNDFSNVGFSVGELQKVTVYSSGDVTDGTVQRFFDNYLLPYNQRNNPDFPGLHYIDENGDIRSANVKVYKWALSGGGNDYRTVYELTDVETGEPVRINGNMYLPYGEIVRNAPYREVQLPASEYDPDNLMKLPEQFASMQIKDQREVYLDGDGTQSAHAVIQAGGKVSIKADESLNNGILFENKSVSFEERDPLSINAGSSTRTVIKINAQLPPDLQQKQVNPLTLPGFSLPSGEHGLFRLSNQNTSTVEQPSVQDAGLTSVQTATGVGGVGSIAGGLTTLAGSADSGTLENSQALALAATGSAAGSHHYLIETNPALTSLKQFMSSDYLLGQLGYNPDEVQKRLGDGLYEQRLIREAIVSRTGQRYIHGLTSDEEMFRYLMDNAIASKDALNLSLGVGLTAAQVAALTHDIVWLEEHEVNGEKVLVPVLYLAQAEGRLMANGALIMGEDVSLISGGDLNNQGTLRATNNLSAVAENIRNSGLIEAGGRLDLLAEDSILNNQGGVISGRDVSLAALTGDIINERNVIADERTIRGTTWETSHVDNASRIEATGNLVLSAGRDIDNRGGALQAGNDLDLAAGRDVTISSVEDRTSTSRGSNSFSNATVQVGAEVSAGRDLSISAGRDLTVVASDLDAGRDLGLAAGNNVLIASAADESHSYYKTKKVTQQDDSVKQQSSNLAAGGDLNITAGDNLVMVASNAEAGGEAYLFAGENLALLSAEDLDYHLYQKKKKGSFGSKSFRRDEVTDMVNVGSSITTGGDLTLVSGGDQTYQAAHLESGNDLTLASGGEITFEGVKDLHQESHEKSKSSFTWQSAKGKGQTDETLRQSELIAQGQLAIRAVDGLNIDIRHIDQKTVSQTIDAMVQADPQLAWLKEMEQRGDVDWRTVKEIHDSWSYSSSGLGAGAQLAVAIVVAAMTGGAGVSALGVVGVTGVSAATAAVANAVAVSVITNATISTINNRGDLGDVFKDVTSSDAMKGYIVSGVTAGLTSKYFDGWTKTETVNGSTLMDKVNTSKLLSEAAGVGQFAANQVLQTATSTALSQALGQDVDWGNALQGALANAFAAAGFNAVGDIGTDKLNTAQMAGLHAIIGGLAAEANGGDFITGALAAGVNKALANTLADQFSGMSDAKQVEMMTMTSQLVGLLAAASINDSDNMQALQTGAWVAKMGEQYNRQLHTQEVQLAKRLAEMSGGRYTAAQMEDALRLSNNAEMGVVASTDMIAGMGGVVKYDEGGTWIDVGNGYLVQVLNHQLDPEIVKFVAANTDGYSWDNQFLGIYPETQTPERPLEFPGCVSCAAGLSYPLPADYRSEQQLEQDRRAMTIGIASLFGGGIAGLGLRTGAFGTAATVSTEALVSGGATAIGQLAVTGDVNPSQVAVAGLLGPISGGWSRGAGAFGLSTSKELAGLVVINAGGAVSAEQIKNWVNSESGSLGATAIGSGVTTGSSYGIGKLPIKGGGILGAVGGSLIGTAVEEQINDK